MVAASSGLAGQIRLCCRLGSLLQGARLRSPLVPGVIARGLTDDVLFLARGSSRVSAHTCFIVNKTDYFHFAADCGWEFDMEGFLQWNTFAGGYVVFIKLFPSV